ncbi:MAG: tetratricopeptide repeat protein [Nitrospirota bacterium]
MTRISWTKRSLYIIILTITPIFIYLNSLNNGFVWDDTIVIVQNDHFKSFTNIIEYFTHDFCKGIANHPCPSFYRPVIAILHLLEYKIWGDNPSGYHLLSVLFHTGVVIAVYQTALILFKNETSSLISGLIFAAHPIHVESVSFISAMTDPPAALFILIAFIGFVSRDIKRRYYYLSLFSFALALLSKEMAVTFPLLLFIYIYLFIWKGIRPAIKDISPFILLCVIYLVIRELVIGSDSLPIEFHGLYLRLLNVPHLIIGYAKVLLFPVNLNILRPTLQGKGIMDPQIYIPLVLLTSIIIFIVRRYQQYREISFSIAWFFITSLPLLNIIPIPNPTVVDHFIYIPSIGINIFMGGIIGMILDLNADRPLKKKVLFILLSFILISFSLITINRNLVWRDNSALWRDTVKKNPDSYKAHHNLGLVYYKEGEISLAIKEYKEAIRTNPDSPLTHYDLAFTHYDLGTIYAERGNIDLAINEYKKAIEINNNYFEAQFNLALTYQRKGDIKNAIKKYQDIISLQADKRYQPYQLSARERIQQLKRR